MADAKEWLTINEAADEFRISRATLFELLRDGKLTRYQRGADVRVYLSRAELVEFKRPKPVDV